ncbi:type II CRISPR-associated endonuclease Cas1, partial [Streptococcus pneumoniae]
FNTLFGNDFSREQDNDVNASLDYGYTLILSMFAREIVLSGCMTQFGLKHANQFNQFNLASDIMEPFRPIIDRIVYE